MMLINTINNAACQHQNSRVLPRKCAAGVLQRRGGRIGGRNARNAPSVTLEHIQAVRSVCIFTCPFSFNHRITSPVSQSRGLGPNDFGASGTNLIESVRMWCFSLPAIK